MLRPLIAAPLLFFVTVSAAFAAAAACPAPFNGAGNAFFYDAQSPAACDLGWVDSDHVVAMNRAQWQGSIHCGECLRVIGPHGTVVAKVVDECPECLDGELDLSPRTFLAIAGDLALGRAPVMWERIACPTSGPLVFSLTDTSNPFYVSLLVREHRYGVADVALLHQGTYQPMSRNNNNRFIFTDASAVSQPLQLRVTATTGEVLEQTLPNFSSQNLAGAAQFAPCEAVFEDGFEG